MYIDKKKFKSLEILDGKKFKIYRDTYMGKWLDDLVFDSEECRQAGYTHGLFLNNFLGSNLKRFRENLFMISDPVMKLVSQNWERMEKCLIEEVLKPQVGALLVQDGSMYLYEIFDCTKAPKDDKEQCKWTAAVVFISKDGEIFNATLASNRLDHEHDGKRRIMYESAIDSFEINFACFSTFLVTLAFLQFADTEKIYIENGQKKNVARGEMVKNSSGHKMKYIDSRWVREIIHVGDYAVRGHFRLQPYKDGKKLIYINEFMKHGYHRRAQKDVV